MAAPVSTPLPTAPNRSMAPADFVSASNAFVAAYEPFRVEMDAIGAYSQAQAEAALAAAVAGNLSELDLSTLAGWVIGVNSGGDALEGVELITPFDTVALLKADITLTASNTTVGDIIKAQGFRYEAVASGGDIITAGGVHLKVLETDDGAYNVLAFGATGDGVTDDTAAIQSALDAGPTVFPTGSYILDAATMVALTYNGLSFTNSVTFETGAELVLVSANQYNHVLVATPSAQNATLRGVVITGNDAWANGIVLSGIGGGSGNHNVNCVNCRVTGIKSEIVITGDQISQREGGAAFIMELEGSGALIGCSVYDSTFAIRYAPAYDIFSNYSILGLHAEECESILNSTPSNFDNRKYAQTQAIEDLTKSSLTMDGITFKNCGKSSDARAQLSFTWRDRSGGSGLASGNYTPWAGIFHGTADTGTFGSLNWEPKDFDVADTEWSDAATYTAGNVVKFTNDGKLGGVFCFGRVGNISINNVKGHNESGAPYGTIGAVFRGIMQLVDISNVSVKVDCDSIFHFGTTPSSTWDLQPFMLARYVTANNVENVGLVTSIAESDMPINGSWETSFAAIISVDYEKNAEAVALEGIKVTGTTNILHSSLSTDAPAEATTFDDTTILGYHGLDAGAVREGKFSDFATLLTDRATSGKREVFEQVLVNGVKILASTGSPEGVVTAPIGSTFHRTDGGAGTSFYVKESGTGNTGWVGK